MLTIELCDKEEAKWTKFQKKHSACGGPRHELTIGTSNTQLICLGTGLGWIFKCQCIKCGKIKDITNTDNW